MHTTRFINQMRLGWCLGLLCMALSLSLVSFAAEVKPIAVEVVGEPGSARSIAPSAPPAPLPADTFAKAIDPVWAEAPRAQHDEMMHSWHLGEQLTDILIPVLAICLIFGGPIVLIIVLATLRYRARARREKLHSENIARLIEAGRDVPLEMLQGGASGKMGGKAEDNLRNGIKNVGVGSGLLIFLTLFLGIKIGSVGFIMIGYGLSQLAVWKWVDSKQTSARQSIGIDRD